METETTINLTPGYPNQENSTLESPLLKSALPESSISEKPILIELKQAQKTRNGYFRPEAYVKLTKALRTSGILLALPGEELKNLLFMLTFITANGDCNPTVHQLAHAMQVTVPKVKSRMQRLISFQWQSEPLVIFLKRESGLDAYTVNAKLIAYEHTQESVPQPSANAPAMVAGGREAVIAYSREHYTKPRVEVEQMIEEQLRPTPVSTEAVIDESKDHEIGAIKHHLMRVGVSPEQADYLLSHFDRVRIQRQLQWLPYRHARNQAGFLIVAIEDNYEAPLALRPRVKSRDVEERIGESLEVNQSSAGGAPSDPQSLKEIAPERVGDLAETGTSTGVSDPINR